MAIMPIKEGKICNTRRLIISDFLNINLKREKAYAPRDATTIVRADVATATCKVFRNHRG
jgi:hypothetical protein